MSAGMAAAFAHIEPVRLAGFVQAKIRAVGKPRACHRAAIRS
jgi:hypothetical protein